jgi:hypothetical protein
VSGADFCRGSDGIIEEGFFMEFLRAHVATVSNRLGIRCEVAFDENVGGALTLIAGKPQTGHRSFLDTMRNGTKGLLQSLGILKN